MESRDRLSDRHSITIVRMPGSSCESGFHLEFLSEDDKVKVEPGMEAYEAEGSPQTRDFKRSPDR